MLYIAEGIVVCKYGCCRRVRQIFHGGLIPGSREVGWTMVCYAGGCPFIPLLC